MSRFLDAAQPCLLSVRRKAFKAAVTVAPNSQTAAFRVFPEKFYGSWRKLQSDRYCGLGNFERAIELRRVFEVAIGLPLG
jgi:hypothetical protein